MIDDLKSSTWLDEFKEVANTKDVEKTWKCLKDKILNLRDRFIPCINPSSKPKWIEKGCIPLDISVRNLIKLKHINHRNWIKSIDTANEENARLAYTKVRNQVDIKVRTCKRQYEKLIAMKAKTQPRMFWAHTRRKMKSKSGIAPLLSDVNDVKSVKHLNSEKANILQSQFCSVFTDEPKDSIPKFPSRTEISAPFPIITNDMVKDKLNQINPNKSCGPDDIHPRLLREVAEYISEPISLLMNMSLDQSAIPNDWKNATICPVFKKGSPRLPVNYRPISLTCILCKMLESFVREPVMKHLLDNKLLSNKQYGFISGRSTTTQLLFYLDKCLKTVAAGGVVDVIYFDFAKAFDTVPHQRLMKKVYAYGIRGKLYQWIKAFLTNRKQTVKVNGISSVEAAVTSGIPQGTVLGPLLVVIYINDLLDNVKSNGLLFADDTKIFKEITGKDDALSMQYDINSMEKWTHDWLLSFHPGKCHVVTLGKLENIQLAFRYTVNGEEIEHVFNEKDLGVYIDSDLTFIEHVTTKVRIANAILGQIRRSFSYLDGATFAILYKSFVRPHLEHLQSVW